MGCGTNPGERAHWGGVEVPVEVEEGLEFLKPKWGLGKKEPRELRGRGG